MLTVIVCLVLSFIHFCSSGDEYLFEKNTFVNLLGIERERERVCDMGKGRREGEIEHKTKTFQISRSRRFSMSKIH